MDMNDLFDAMPPLVLAERTDASKTTNAQRLIIVAMVLIADILKRSEEPHPRDYMHLTGDASDYQLCVATGQGVHGKGAKLFKSSGGYIRRVRENVRSLLRFVPPDELASYLEEQNLTQQEFITKVLELPSVVSTDK